MTKLSVAIIGAGMGGLATAAALHRAGIKADVYEQASKFTRLGAGIQIGCNAMKVLRGLGLESVMRAQSFYPRSWNNKEYDTGEIRFDMIFGEAAEESMARPICWDIAAIFTPRSPAPFLMRPFISITSWSASNRRPTAVST